MDRGLGRNLKHGDYIDVNGPARIYARGRVRVVAGRHVRVLHRARKNAKRKGNAK